MSHTPDQPDKGYTTGFYDGKQAERDRILALLEPYTDCQDEWCGSYCDCLRAEWVIRLIKGENK